MEASNDLFINLIQNNRIIYDKRSKDFKNNVKKDEVWMKIAAESRMTVDSAKKRYVSLRQKYCREKTKAELRRRAKLPGVRGWVYLDRLTFLDEFIQPRATYTNDTGFDELQDTDSQGASGSAAEVEHDLENEGEGEGIGIGAEDIDDEMTANNNSEIATELDIPIIYLTNNTDDAQNQSSYELLDNDFNCFGTEIVSEYSGEVTTFHPALYNLPSTETVVRSSRDEELDRIVPETGTRNTSPNRSPGHTLGTLHRSELLQVPQNNTSVENALTSRSQQSCTNLVPISRKLPQNTSAPKSVTSNGPPAPSITLSSKGKGIGNAQLNQPARDSGPKNGASSQKSARTTQQCPTDMASASRPISKITINRTSTNPPPTSTATSSSEKDKSMEAIRNKMDSCLNAINSKVSEKSQRSPHAPFLAYLATKLPSVPKERITNLEREILELVDAFIL